MNTENKPCDIMIDLETVGKRAGCAILSIGATVVGPYSENLQDSFYATISLPSCYALGLGADTSTLEWWSKQNPELIVEAFSGHKDIKKVLLDFTTYLCQWPNKRVWGNSASFDLKILELAYIAADMQVPWGYRDEMCYRTLKNLFPAIKPAAPNTQAHNALADAQYQAAHLKFILDFIGS